MVVALNHKLLANWGNCSLNQHKNSNWTKFGHPLDNLEVIENLISNF